MYRYRHYHPRRFRKESPSRITGYIIKGAPVSCGAPFLSLCTICAVFGAIKYDLTRAVFESDATLYAAAGFGGFSVKYPTEENKD